MRTMRKSSIGTMAFALVGFVTASTFADTISIGASRDVTIFQNNVNNSSGGGNGLFAGTNGANSPRRALIGFNIAGNVPAGAVIQAVQLTLTLGQVAGSGGGTGGTSGSPFVDLFRVSKDWGEGTVQSGGAADSLGGQGQGAQANTGDATWNAAMYSATTPTLWATPGGDFAATASASQQIVGTTINVAYNWTTTPGLVADVQSWLNSPASNFGWILRNEDEAGTQTLRAFYSRDTFTASFRPVLSITYTVPEPASLWLAGVSLIGLAILRKSSKNHH
jgi:hypothetical protein